MTEGMKICKGPCGRELPLSEFHRHPSTRDRHRMHCRQCSTLLVKNWRKKNPEKVRDNVKKHAEKRRAAARQWRRENPEKVRDQKIRAKLRREGKLNG